MTPWLRQWHRPPLPELLAVAILVSASAILVSCGGDDDGTLTDPPPGPAEPTGLIAFTMQCAQVGLGDLYVMEPDGENLRQLTTDLLIEDFTWFRGGQEIAFLRNVGTWNFDIFAIKPDGTGERRLTTGINAYYLELSASPDGEWLLVREDRFPNARLFRVAWDGSVVDTLATNAYSLSGPRGGSPWIPGGTEVLFQPSDDTGGTGELVAVSVASKAQRLVFSDGPSGMPVSRPFCHVAERLAGPLPRPGDTVAPGCAASVGAPRANRTDRFRASEGFCIVSPPRPPAPPITLPRLLPSPPSPRSRGVHHVHQARLSPGQRDDRGLARQDPGEPAPHPLHHRGAAHPAPALWRRAPALGGRAP